MYSNGLGVPQNHKEAVKLYRQGKGVPQDYVLAHMWWNICGSIGDEVCVRNRNIVEKKMSPQQIEEAQRLARNWKPKK